MAEDLKILPAERIPIRIRCPNVPGFGELTVGRGAGTASFWVDVDRGQIKGRYA